MHSEFGVGMKNAEELRLNQGGWQVCEPTGVNGGTRSHPIFHPAATSKSIQSPRDPRTYRIMSKIGWGN